MQELVSASYLKLAGSSSRMKGGSGRIVSPVIAIIPTGTLDSKAAHYRYDELDNSVVLLCFGE
jgi:hypothetical protein